MAVRVRFKHGFIFQPFSAIQQREMVILHVLEKMQQDNFFLFFFFLIFGFDRFLNLVSET